MTLFVNLRAGGYGAVCSAYLLDGDALADPPQMVARLSEAVKILARGRNVLLATHGFNVPYLGGLRSLARLETALAIKPDELFLGVLWPGDWIIPAINYPFEDGVATRAGGFLGDFCNGFLASAASVSLLSHSLGARVVLQAIVRSSRRIRRACITAGAVNDACLVEEFAAAAANCDSIVTLSSMEDRVLQFAYPPGDLLADIFDPDHKPFEAALGRKGALAPFPGWSRNYQIPDSGGFDHSDYLPPSDLSKPAPDPAAKWSQSAAFMAQAWRGQSPSWPPP